MELTCPARGKPNLCKHCGRSPACDDMMFRAGLPHQHSPGNCKACRAKAYLGPRDQCDCGAEKLARSERCASCASREKVGRRSKKPRTPGVRVATSDGYIKVYSPGAPGANSKGEILEHRLVMSEILGRPLVPGENVHHIDGDRTNNAPENLELWTKPQPTGVRIEDAIAAAVEVLARYAPDRLAA